MLVQDDMRKCECDGDTHSVSPQHTVSSAVIFMIQIGEISERARRIEFRNISGDEYTGSHLQTSGPDTRRRMKGFLYMPPGGLEQSFSRSWLRWREKDFDRHYMYQAWTIYNVAWVASGSNVALVSCRIATTQNV